MTAPTEEAGPALVAPDPDAATESAATESAATESAATDSKPEPPAVFLELPEIPPRPQRRPSRWWRYGFPAALVILVVLVPILILAGLHALLVSNHGRLIVTTTNPAEPGWEAAVEPTPTAVLATLSESGDLSSVSVLTLTSDGHSNVIFVPADTHIPSGGGHDTMVTAYKSGGAAGLKAALESTLGVDVGEVTTADVADWEGLVAPVGTLTVSNPDDVTVNDTRLFNKGSIDLTPAEAGIYLRSRNWAEDDTNRLLRQEAFWRSWMAKIAAKGTADAVPGETDSGLGRFIRTMAAGQVDYHVLPVKVQALPDAYAGVYVPIAKDVNALLAQTVPFPLASPAGSRPLVRVLDGTGQLDHGVGVARALASAGAQIDGIGNASNFEVPTTQIVITGSDHRAQAEGLQAALGFGDIIERQADAFSSDSVDVTVILGADALGKPVTTGSIPGTTQGTDG